MKLLFIENRHKTFFLDAIAKELEKEHEIFWVVQNKEFIPKTGKVFKIPFPNRQEVNREDAKVAIDYDKIIASDRQQNFFDKKEKGYFYYYADKINQVILNIQPDIVFGEATAFHELLTIEICKKHTVLYLNPSTCRYPTGRFSFYKYDTLEPFGGSNVSIDKNNALAIIDAISNRNVKPDYMKKANNSTKKQVADKLKIVKSYMLGEKYNTPSPKVKYKIEKQKKALIQKWDAISEDTISAKFSILYPLQMQPEANIDVWGRKHRDQLKIIIEIHKLLKADEVLYVKPNPKSKYELSEELINYINAHKNIIALHHKISMDAIFNKIDLVVTVTGTIAMECILSNKPVITLVKTLNNTAANCVYANDFNEVKEYIARAKNNLHPSITREDQINFLDLLHKTSFEGMVSDPFSTLVSVQTENIQNLNKAFNVVLNMRM